MKKLNNLTHILFLFTFCFTLFSCGTEEEEQEDVLSISVSNSTIPVGESMTFMAATITDGDISSQAVFFVNGTQIEGNTFIPTEANDTNKVYATYNGLTSSTINFASTEVIPSAYTQKVLFEDYTGTWCGWCPRMTTIVHYLTDYSDRIIPIAIHTEGAPQDPWMYEHAKDMQSSSNYDAGAAPAGQINRIYHFDPFQNSHPCPNEPEIYYPQLDEFLNQSAPLGLAVNSSLNGNNLDITVKVGFTTDSVPDVRLVVNLVEDNLFYYQYNYFSGSGVTCDSEFDYANMPHPIPNFQHDHVLLKSFTDIYGDVIPQNQITNGGIYTQDFNVQLPSNVTNSQNLTIVAFVLGNGNQISTREVINVQSAQVGTNQDFD